MCPPRESSVSLRSRRAPVANVSPQYHVTSGWRNSRPALTSPVRTASQPLRPRCTARSVRPLSSHREGVRPIGLPRLRGMRHRQSIEPRFGSWQWSSGPAERRWHGGAHGVARRARPRRHRLARSPGQLGCGLAIEASGALLACGFGVGLSEIWARFTPEHTRSIPVCEWLGLTVLGVTAWW